MKVRGGKHTYRKYKCGIIKRRKKLQGSTPFHLSQG
jgi:hypothetical protein